MLIAQKTSFKKEITAQLKKVNDATRQLIRLSDAEISEILHEFADLTDASHAFLIAENQKDLARMSPDDPKYDRLLLNENRLLSIANDLRKVATLPSPLHKTLSEYTTPNGLEFTKTTVPLGVVGIVYESRPNVTFDVFALCFKSGNAVVLKGSRDAHDSNIAIVSLIHNVLKKRNLANILYLAPSEREALGHILKADKYVNTIIPRGSQGLINFVRNHSKVPVIETGAGIVHTYFDKSADLAQGRAIIENAKTRRLSVCNALDSLIIHQDRLADLPLIFKDFDTKHGLQIFADTRAWGALKNNYDHHLLALAKKEHFGIEFLSMKISIKTVKNIDGALDHIAAYSSKHSEAILAKDPAAIDYFLKNVDAAVVYANASTGFTDGGEFGMGAEIGISTQKLHARGPMALPELTSYKWVVQGTGQVRGK
jgi:glutamate-5-semialdehyde dehydrogenase